MYLTWYGLGRTFIELLRTDSLTTGGSIRISSLIGLLCFLIGGTLLIVFLIKNKGNRAYTPVCAEGVTAETVEESVETSESSETEETDENTKEASTSDDAPPDEAEENNNETENTNEENEKSEENEDGKLD